MARIDRRGFLRAAALTGTLLGSGLLGTGLALARTRAWAVNGAGTTLEAVATPVPGEGYRRLVAGPGWPIVVRTDLVDADPKRDDRRDAIAAFIQFTDLHLVDAQSPARFEYVHPLLGGAFRPQETLGALAASRLVRRVNSLPGAPVTGRPMDFVITTGDSTDNHETAELDWYFGVLNGGRVAQNTGDPAVYEGVQNSGSALYWHPGGEVTDRFRDKGFPVLEDLLAAAIRPFDSEGLRVPWYATFGNHDNTVVGTLPDHLIPGLADWYTGSRKIIVRDERGTREVAALLRGHRTAEGLLDGGIIRTVTPDERRRPFTTGEFVRAHLDPANTGPGPVGHGFTEDNADGVVAYYTFRIAPGVTGISLDTTNTSGFAEGSLGLAQYQWLEQVLIRGSSRYYDAFGRRRRQHVSDELFVLFSHHTSSTMSALLPDSRRPGETRVDGATVVRLLHRFPNVLAWVNGHSHRNAITPHPADDPDCGFWEINTASHVDFPQLARIVELVDNGDGTLSLFTTLMEADSPYQVDHDDRGPDTLAALYRELSCNDPHTDHTRLGTPADRNAELLVPGRLPIR
ncbi:metallophosphoesterase [Saccharopolyspora subtropica]|uniref:Metallophosphoesterase n=1 Tax=Saccharopolyspora thermophila TaxID=89367 RepID=A0A917JW65_9PSEU|nr:TIGR03767 family metallophosphoesterase [Saccharopolyspora subtropica]GGI84736.1 metallophosphoesterase [Saccharopolyspora subtropica]